MNLQICTTEGEDLLLRDVSTYVVDNSTLRVLYCNGTHQNYPLRNVRWYGPEEKPQTVRGALEDALDLTDVDLTHRLFSSDPGPPSD